VVGLFRKRQVLDPLVVDPVAEQASISPQDNVPGAPAPDLETIAHGNAAPEALVGGAWGVTIGFGANSEIDPKSVVPRPDSELQDD
jgi:hypothetical protein